MPQVQYHLDLTQNELRQAVIHKLATAPTSPLEGQIYYDTVSKSLCKYDGATWQILVGTNNTIGSLSVVSPLLNTGTSSAPILEIAPASNTTAGSLSILDKNKLDGATALSSASTLVLRDGTGSITATSFIGSLTGTADDATQLAGQAASYYLSRTNHTGTQLAASISDFDTQVRTNRLDQLTAPTADVSFGTKKITDLGTPTADADAATKLYVDSAITTASYPKKYSVSIGDNSSSSFVITHNLNTRDLVAQIYTTASPYSTIITDIEYTTANTLTVLFGSAPTSNEFRLVVIG